MLGCSSAGGSQQELQLLERERERGSRRGPSLLSIPGWKGDGQQIMMGDLWLQPFQLQLQLEWRWMLGCEAQQGWEGARQICRPTRRGREAGEQEVEMAQGWGMLLHAGVDVRYDSGGLVPLATNTEHSYGCVHTQ